MRASIRVAVTTLCAAGLACSRPSPPPPPSAEQAGAGIDSLNARLDEAYRSHDPGAYGALFTDSAVFEWPAFDSPRGPAELEAMARNNWASLRDMDLRLHVSSH